MKNYDSNTIAALSSGSLVLRHFLYVRGKTKAGAPISFGFWNGEDNVSVSIVSAIDGATESREYVGCGALLDVDQIVAVIGLEIRTTKVKLSQIHTSVQSMVRANDIRHAVVEIHRGLFGVDTGQLVAPPHARFLGKVNDVSVDTPSAGGEGSITLDCVPSTRNLTRVNTAKKSDETQKLRLGDRSRKNIGAVSQVELWWGESKSDNSDLTVR